MISTEQIIYIILFLLISLGLIVLWIRKKQHRIRKQETKRKVPETIEELFEEYEEPLELEPEPEPVQKIKKKKPKKPVSLLDQDFEF